MTIIDTFSKKLISKYKMKSLFTEYFIHILLTITLPIFMLIIAITLLFINSYNTETKENIRTLAEKNAHLADNLFSSLDTYFENLIANGHTASLLKNTIQINNVAGSLSPIHTISQNIKLPNEQLSNIDSIYLYSYVADYVYALRGSTSSFFEKFDNKTWYEEYLNRDCNNYIASLMYKNTEYLTFCYEISYSNSDKGLLIINISKHRLANMLNIPDTTVSGFQLTSLTTGEVLADQSFDTGSSANHYTTTLYDSTLELTYSYSKNILPTSFQYNLIFVALSSVAVVVLSIILGISFAKKQYRSVLTIITSLEDPNIQNVAPETNELYYLLEKTKDIASTNKNLEKQLLEKITNLKKTQSIALQTQINPHFLYNTLNMISYSVQERIPMKDDDASHPAEMIKLLSNMLRYSLKTEEYLVPLQDELEVLKSYIEIAALKYNHTFTVNWNVEPDIYEQTTLKSTLQPLVENAIEHGVKLLYDERPGLITISAYTAHDYLYINVTDNGVGMSEKDYEELMERLNSDSLFQNQNIGLKNVISRIKLLFNDKGGFEISSGPQGTSVTIYHPIITFE